MGEPRSATGRRAFLRGRFRAAPERLLAVVGEGCLTRRGVVCAGCRDICEPQAIRFRPRSGGVAMPMIDGGRCTGCGACLSVCPVQALGLEPEGTLGRG